MEAVNEGCITGSFPYLIQRFPEGRTLRVIKMGISFSYQSGSSFTSELKGDYFSPTHGKPLGI
jgi:hypothetical protein